MSNITVKVHCPIGAAVRVRLDGEERNEISVPEGQGVKVFIEQVPNGNRPSKSELFKIYLSSIFGKRIRYGADVPSPFRAEFAGTIAPGTEGTVGFSLVCLEGRYRIVPDQDVFVKGSVRSCEVNDDSGLWKAALGVILVPLLVILSLGLVALFSSEVPAVAQAGFGTLYVIMMLAGIGMFLQKTKHKRYYSTGVEQNE